MHEHQFYLLEQVGRGETAFASVSNTTSDLKAFQQTLHSLKRLQKSGHLDIIEMSQVMPSDTTAMRYHTALVSLTEFGKRDLAAQGERKAKRRN